jgi:hypothetical protein
MEMILSHMPFFIIMKNLFYFVYLIKLVVISMMKLILKNNINIVVLILKEKEFKYDFHEFIWYKDPININNLLTVKQANLKN